VQQRCKRFYSSSNGVLISIQKCVYLTACTTHSSKLLVRTSHTHTHVFGETRWRVTQTEPVFVLRSWLIPLHFCHSSFLQQMARPMLYAFLLLGLCAYVKAGLFSRESYYIDRPTLPECLSELHACNSVHECDKCIVAETEAPVPEGLLTCSTLVDW
jgi:hypothetical protein